MLPSLSLPPLEFCLGTSPTQAEKSRPDRKALGSARLATSAVANAGQTPGIASSRLLVAFDRCQAMCACRTPVSEPLVLATDCREQQDAHGPLPGAGGRLDQRRLLAVARRPCARLGPRPRTRQDTRELS